jgi:hypothetical protein
MLCCSLAFEVRGHFEKLIYPEVILARMSHRFRVIQASKSRMGSRMRASMLIPGCIFVNVADTVQEDEA